MIFGDTILNQPSGNPLASSLSGDRPPYRHRNQLFSVSGAILPSEIASLPLAATVAPSPSCAAKVRPLASNPALDIAASTWDCPRLLIREAFRHVVRGAHPARHTNDHHLRARDHAARSQICKNETKPPPPHKNCTNELPPRTSESKAPRTRKIHERIPRNGTNEPADELARPCLHG